MSMQISRLAIIYGSEGGEEAVRVDKRVRTSLIMTRKSAERGAATTERWMDAHKTALLAIGAATAGILAALLRSSPAVSAELSSIRLAFSMIAMELGDRLLPIFMKLEEWSWKLSDSFSGLSDRQQKVITAVVIFIAILLALAAAAALVVVAVGAIGITLTTAATLLAIAAAGAILVAILVSIQLYWEEITTFVLDGLKTIGNGLIELAKLIAESFINVGHMIYDPIKDAVLDLVGWAKGAGEDFVKEFAKGLGGMDTAAKDAFEPIAKYFDHDRAVNDRKRFKEGFDFGKNFIGGIRSALTQMTPSVFNMAQPAPQATPATAPAAGGRTLTVVIEQGAINVTGSGSGAIDTRTIVDEVVRRMGNQVGARF